MQHSPSFLFAFEQQELDGHPIHFTPFFFDFIIYVNEVPIIITRIIIIIKSSILQYPFHVRVFYAGCFNEYSFLISLLAFIINPVTIAAITIIANKPGTKPAPKVPFVIKVPI